MKDFYQLFVHELKTIYDGEHQLIAAMPHIISAANDDKLQHALQGHLEETRKQVKRLEEIGKEMNLKMTRETCEPIKGLLHEMEQLMRTDYDAEVKDAALIICAQQIEHFEISSYGSLKAMAKHFKMTKVLHLLEETSKEEGNANKKLNEVAEGSFFTPGINVKAHKRHAA